MFFSVPAYAGVANCGDLSEDAADKAHDVAERVDTLVDVTKDIENLCDAAQDFKRWERDQPDSVLQDTVFQDKRSKALGEAGAAIESVIAPLLTLDGLIRADLPKDRVERAVRVARIRTARNEVRGFQEALRQDRNALLKLME